MTQLESATTAGLHTVQVTVNGHDHAPRTSSRGCCSSHFLRETLGLTGTHIGCDTTSCGACTVLVDGTPVKSCTMLAVQADGARDHDGRGPQSEGGQLHPIQAAFKEEHGLQCGFCTPGMMLVGAALLEREPATRPTRTCAGRSPATSAAAPAT